MSAYFDLAGMLPPLSVPRSHRGTPRIGDRAVIYAYLSIWRRGNPDRPLVLIEDALCSNVAPYERLTRWMANELKAEYRLLRDEGLPSDLHCALALNTDSLWARWKTIRHDRSRPALPTMELSAQQRAAEFLSRYRLSPGSYITVQPLIQVDYNYWRARPPDFWSDMINQITQCHPVVVVGGPECRQLGRPSEGAYYAFEEDFNILESLALVSNARVHLGGETGLTFWAPIIGTATVALYEPNGFEYLPLGFGRSLSIVDLQAVTCAPTGALQDGWGYCARWEPT